MHRTHSADIKGKCLLASAAFMLACTFTGGAAAATFTEACRTVDSRAYDIAGVCKIPNISQSECQGVAGPLYSSWQPMPTAGGFCVFVVPPRASASRSGVPISAAPSAATRRLGSAAANLGGVTQLLGLLDQFQSTWRSMSENRARYGVDYPGGIDEARRLGHEAAALQHYANGLRFEQYGLSEQAAGSYDQALQAATLSGNERLIDAIRRKQNDLICSNGIGYILSVGQNPEDRLEKFSKLRGNCGDTAHAGLIDALIDAQLDLIPPQSRPAGVGGRTQNSTLRQRLAADLARLFRRDAERRHAAAGMPFVPTDTPEPAAGPQPPEEDLAIARAREQQASKRRIFCGQSSDAAACLRNETWCFGYAADRQKYQQCELAFHDPNIWYGAMKNFWADPAETQKAIQQLIAEYNALF
jgi:hypothetical protein